MKTTIKQVTEVQIGDFVLVLDEEKLRKLAKICELADETLVYLTEDMEQLAQMTYNFSGIEKESFSLIRTISNAKKDYRLLKSLCVRRKEEAHE